ncbi:MAG TPA: metallophosphoesterase [Vitreimonas sp.]|uniref:metallophosphoesterase family protein n=1 Tax=Vitreimonas sp. TaxID=3069702 RepID=UPI002D54ECA5|nr:metallophosphoesterase [Vitreimonas sp.]HYD86963.1 metallophosphoesterase [Vitreimonas sp.]
MTLSPEARPVRVAAIGDLHVSESMQRPYRDLFTQVSNEADAVVICGDLTNYGKPSEAHVLAEDLHACAIPVIAVLGNHDHESNCVEEVKHILTQTGAHILDGGEAVEVLGIGFAGCMGAMGGFGRGMLSAFGEPAVKTFVQACLEETMKLETGLRMLRTERAIAVTHYAPVTSTLEGEPLEIYPFLGNSRLAETIDRFDNVRFAVHGHAHRGVFRGATPKGVPVYNVARPVLARMGERPFTLLDV